MYVLCRELAVGVSQTDGISHDSLLSRNLKIQ